MIRVIVIFHMKKSIVAAKLKLNGETVKRLRPQQLTAVHGGAPVATHDMPCIEHTLFDCP